MNNISRKHHYLPEFYLKGFTGEDGKFSVFDLKTNRLKTKRMTPSQVFFEYDRNTYEVEGVKDDFVEKMYGLLETIIGHSFKKIREQDTHSSLSTMDILNIILFTGSLYWRIPGTDDEIKNIIASSTADELGFKIINKRTAEEAPKVFFDLLKDNDAFTGSYRTIKPVLDYIKGFKASQINDWTVYFATQNNRGEKKEIHLIGDNPIIFRSKDSNNIFDQELIMPLSSGKTLYHTRGKKINIIDPILRMDLDILIFLQSEKYVCGPDRGYLEKVAELADIYRDTYAESMNHLRDGVFRIFVDS